MIMSALFLGTKSREYDERALLQREKYFWYLVLDQKKLKQNKLKRVGKRMTKAL